MIYTVTLNPALDYILRLPRLSSEDVNRADSAQLLCGGKGINVSMVLSGLGVPTRALGFVAGFTGRHQPSNYLRQTDRDNSLLL